MENTAHREELKWRFAAPLAWGLHLWLLLLAFPIWSDEAAFEPILGVGCLLPLALGPVLAVLGRPGLAAALLLCVYPAALAGSVAARDEAEPLGATWLGVATLCLWIYGAAALEALRPRASSPAGARIVALPDGRRRVSPRAALAARAHRLRLGLTALLGLGALAIAAVAPSLGRRQLASAWGEQAASGSVLVAMTAAALGCMVAGVFLSALLRPQSSGDRQARSPMRVATGLMLALVGATTFYVLQGG